MIIYFLIIREMTTVTREQMKNTSIRQFLEIVRGMIPLGSCPLYELFENLRAMRDDYAKGAAECHAQIENAAATFSTPTDFIKSRAEEFDSMTHQLNIKIGDLLQILDLFCDDDPTNAVIRVEDSVDYLLSFYIESVDR